MSATKAVAQSESDNDLMQAYVQGNAVAFNELYLRYKKPLYQFVLHGCGNPAAASDVFQDIWVSVVKARTSFQNTGTFKSWLYRIARNKLIDFYRRSAGNATEQTFDEEITQDHVTTINAPLNPLEIAELKDDQDRVHKAIELLPWKQREAVLLKYIAGFTLSEIALEQQEPQETIKSRLRYAYTKLRQHLRASS